MTHFKIYNISGCLDSLNAAKMPTFPDVREAKFIQSRNTSITFRTANGELGKSWREKGSA